MGLVKKLLVVGGGGREHALAWALARSPQVEKIYVAPGNGGTVWLAAESRAAAQNQAIAVEEIAALLDFARSHEQEIDLTVIGPEVPLSMGIVDAFRAAGLRVFGPSRAAAQLESSKAFAKDFMREHGIPTAEYASFTDFEEACDFAHEFGKPMVVKADGLAAGKGVIMCDTPAEAEAALRRIMVAQEFGKAGAQVVIEERLSGPEVSALAFCDGKTVAIMPLARDHKRVFDGDLGPNTGGMGAYAPVPDVDDDLPELIVRTVLQPVVNRMAERGTPYVGVLYAGLMLTADGPKVLEFNCRFGDPETQVILPLLDTEKIDLVDILWACTEGRLYEIAGDIRWRDGACATVVLAAEGYPGEYARNRLIHGLEGQSSGVVVFHAGTVKQGENVVTNGGRVLAVSGYGESLEMALRRAYTHIEQIHFEGMHYRRDIGRSIVKSSES